jgi:ferredoxin
MSDGGVRAVVDRDVCFGFGFCADAMPDVFVLDGSGHATVVDVDGDPELLERVVDDCPRSAISLIRGAPA